MGLWELLPFVATNRLGAGAVWIGIIGSAGYLGYLWNLFFARVTARLSLRRSIVLIMILSAVLLAAAGWQRNVTAYCLLVIAFLLVLGLFDVQYNTLVRHLYDAAERPRRLSRRQLLVAVSGALLAAGFGELIAAGGSQRTAFAAAAVMMLAAALVFRRLPTARDHPMEPFKLFDVVQATLRDPRFRRVAGVLTLYGWVGAGTGTLLVLLYRHIGLGEAQVGWLTAARMVGLLAGLVGITPHLAFRGGLSNYRLCYSSSAAAVAVFMVVGFAETGALTFPLLAAGNVMFGVSVAGFVLATQTTAINLAPADKVTVYVNSLMIVQGLRGMLAPLAVAASLKCLGLPITLIVSAAVGLCCTFAAWMPEAALPPGPAEPDTAGGT